MRALLPILALIASGCAAGPAWEPCTNEVCARCLGSSSYECDACDSMGRVDCTWCWRGFRPCRWCFGVGYESGFQKCISCFGQGRVRCRRCRGTLRAACPKCEGTGRAKCGRWLEPAVADR